MIVVLDACVIYSNVLRHIFMYMGVDGIFKPKWSATILNECFDNIKLNRPDISIHHLEKTRQLMDQSIPDAKVMNFSHLINSLSLPDENDRHVLAVAIHSKAERIVTFNLKDFPEENILPYGIKAQHPDEFLTDLFFKNSEKIESMLEKYRKSLKNPPFSMEQFIETLQKQGLQSFSKELYNKNTSASILIHKN